MCAQDLVSGIRVEESQAFSADDKAMILRTVREQHGSCEAFNTKLKLQVGLQWAGH